jgi:hypothetical protein
MFVPHSTYNPGTHALNFSGVLDFVVSHEKPQRSLLAFSDLDNCAAFVNDFEEAKAYGIMSVENSEALKRILLNVMARNRGECHVRFDRAGRSKGTTFRTNRSFLAGATIHRRLNRRQGVNAKGLRSRSWPAQVVRLDDWRSYGTAIHMAGLQGIIGHNSPLQSGLFRQL